MKLKDAMNKLTQVEINEQIVKELENVYNAKIPEEIKKIISLHDETVFYDDFSLFRGLSFAEILSASSDMSVDFGGRHLLPLFDIGDNDYIVFDTFEQCWYKFNIVDDVKFSKAVNFSEYF